jgi:hypothetical protein
LQVQKRLISATLPEFNHLQLALDEYR